MRGLLFIVFYLVFGNILFGQQGGKPVALQRSPDFEYLTAPDSVGKRSVLKSPSLERNQLKLPYPILFIHGLNSNSSTWDSTTHWMDSLYGLSFGGRFDFCLNYDADYYIANKHFNTPDADLALFTSNIVAADYYYVNFDVGTNGSVHPGYWDTAFVTSNQSAIAKQGLAVKWAIERVLQETGRNKVILMGHSMGGLASREYLQNPANWQPDGDAHVAKLVTTGTPHGGSNSTAYGLGLFLGLDESSEAVRDLRRSYYYTLDSGVFLYGGREAMTDSTMDDNLGVDFYNVDVNCDGVSAQTIVGLNHKPLFRNLDYTCIVGNCDGCIEEGGIGDGVVNNFCAELNNFYPDLKANVFYYNAPAYTEIHTALPFQNYENMQGFDEPEEFQLSYGIDTSTNYSGFITVQSNEPYLYDYDSYKFTMPYQGTVSITVNNMALAELTACVFDSIYNSAGFAVQNFGSSYLDLSAVLTPGDYFLRISAIASTTSYLYPYQFSVVTTPVPPGTTGVNENSAAVLQIFPNPVRDILSLEINEPNDVYKVEILSAIGEVVFTSSVRNRTTINTSAFSKGIYFVKVYSHKMQLVRKFIKE